MNRRWLVVPLLALMMMALAVAASSGHARADQRDFTLINGSASVTIMHVYVSASDLNDWGEDVLGQDVLLPGESVTILFSGFDGEEGTCLYDIRVVGQGGEEGVLYQIDLCSTDTVTFS